MDENRESLQESEISTDQVTPILGDQENTSPNPMASRLNRVRADVDTHLKKLSVLTKAISGEQEVDTAREPISDEELASQLEELSQAELPATEFIIKSGKLLRVAGNARRQINDDIETSRRNYRARLRAIDDELDELQFVHGIKKITVNRKRSGLVKEKDQLTTKIKNLNTEKEARRDQLRDTVTLELRILGKQEDVLIDEAASDSAAIKDDYEEFFQELIDDGTIIQEIQQAYVDSIATPFVDQLIASGRISADERGQFYDELKNRLESSNTQEKTDEPQQLGKLYWYVDGIIRPLLSGDDKGIVTQIVAKTAARDIAKIKSAIIPSLRIPVSVDIAIRKAITPGEGTFEEKEKNFGGIVKKELESQIASKYPNMDIWRAILSSHTANELFGDILQTEDTKIYNKAVNECLKDTGFSDMEVLAYYPTPEAIRNIIFLVAGERTIASHKASGVLDAFSRRGDWNELLDKAEEVYPSLSAARPILENWQTKKYSDLQDHQEIDEFALPFTAASSENDRIRKLATEALSNHALIEILHKKGVVSKTELSVFQQTQDLIESVIEELQQSLGRNDSRLINFKMDARNYKNKLRQVAFSLVQPVNDMTAQQIESMRRLSTVSQKMLDNQDNINAFRFYLASETVDAISENRIEPELIFAIPEEAKLLMDEKMRSMRMYVFKHHQTLLTDSSDLKFLNNVLGEFGQKSEELIRGYQDCLDAGVISRDERELILEFARQFRVISPTILMGYKAAKESGHEMVYIAQLTELASKMTGIGEITDEEREKPEFKDLLKHVYTNNSGQWGSFEGNESCSDRSSDISGFKIAPRYEIDLLSQSGIRIKDGEMLDPEVQERVQRPIIAVSEQMKKSDFNYEKIKTDLSEGINRSLDKIRNHGGLVGVDLDKIQSQEERLFLVLADSLFGTNVVGRAVLKNLLITYEFANYEDISDYVAGTINRVEQASNQDYALLCETSAFYSDRIKEVNRKLVESAWENTEIAALMPEYFKILADQTVSSGRQEKIDRLQIEKLGLSDSFVKQLRKVLEERNKRKYEADEVKKIIRRYEGITGGLTEKASISTNKQTKAFYGQLRSQREKTLEALNVVTGETVDAKNFHLGEVNFQQLLDTEANIREGKYDAEQFASYTTQRFIDLFEEERTKIDQELDKFESSTGKQRKVLNATISKTAEASNARMVGGVCVAGDNPGKYPDENIWNMPNYFQVVLQDPDSLQCQGVVLLHHFNQEGQKVLTASLNPSSTYLYSVDETALFTGIMGVVEQFAADNDFDLIALSQNRTIRTNRTGGQFEKAIDERVAQVGKTFSFATPQQFSYHPSYQLQDMDVVWENGNE